MLYIDLPLWLASTASVSMFYLIAQKELYPDWRVRRVCSACRNGDTASCVECGGTGFRGRLALVEVLFAQAVSRRVFGQRVSAREAAGMALVIAGVALLLFAR